MIRQANILLSGLILLWLGAGTVLPQSVSAKSPSSGGSVGPRTGDTRPAINTQINAPTVTKAQPLKEQEVSISTMLPDIGIGIAALAAICALIFAVLAWLESKRGQESVLQVGQTTSKALTRLSDQIPTTIMMETRLLRSLKSDLEGFAQDIKNHTRNVSISPEPISLAGASNSPSVSLDQIKTLVLAAAESRDTMGLSNIKDLLASQLGTVAQSNGAILSTVQNLKRHLEALSDPQNAALSTLLTQILEPGDALVESAQHLQSTFQKIVTGSRDGDYFLDMLAQTVFLPLSVPLAALNLTETQMTMRISLLGAMERTRQQAAALTRKSGLEMMKIEVRKTAFDRTRHEAILGTEMRTNRADLNDRVAEVLRHGFVQKSQDNSEKVIRKAQVRLYFHIQPTPAPVVPVPNALPTMPTTPPMPEAMVTVEPELLNAQVSISVTPLAEIQIPDAHTAQQLFDAYQGRSSATVSISDWEILADALTISYGQSQNTSALDEILATMFSENTPRTIVPKIGETNKPMYESVFPIPGGIVAEVLRIGIELPSNGSPNRPVLPRVRLTTKEESQVPA